MKDRQAAASAPQARIPFVSSILHWMAMPVIVFIRSGFGFSFLAPKSVFLSFGWASILLFIIAWNEPSIWSLHRGLAVFALGATVLYVLHLIRAFRAETNRKGEHDFYAGTSHYWRLPALSALRSERLDLILQLWIEPAAVLIAAIALQTLPQEASLGTWLFLIAPAMWMKAFLNYWYPLRHEKRERDIYADAEEKMANHTAEAAVPLPSAGGRKPRQKRTPTTDQSEQRDELERAAEILRLIPPYSLEKAEENYRALSKAAHPDAGGALAGTEQMARLNEAIVTLRSLLDDKSDA